MRREPAMRGCFQLHVTSGPHMRPEPKAYMLSGSRVRSGPSGTHPTQESWRSLWECPDFALRQSPVVSMTRLRQAAKDGDLSSRASTRKKDLSYKAPADFSRVPLMRTSSRALVPLQGRRKGDSVAFQPLEQQVALLAGTAGRSS